MVFARTIPHAAVLTVSFQQTGTTKCGTHTDRRDGSGPSSENRGRGGRHSPGRGGRGGFGRRRRSEDRVHSQGRSWRTVENGGRPNPLPSGAFEMLDPHSGEKVVVWGVEGRPDIARPALSDLYWEPAVVIGPGDVSDERLWRVMEGDKYVSQELGEEEFDFEGHGVDAESDLDETRSLEEYGEGFEEGDDEEDEEDDDQFTPYVHNSDSASKPGRPRKLKLFGRDYGPRNSPQPKSSEASVKDKDRPPSASAQGVQSATQGKALVEHRGQQHEKTKKERRGMESATDGESSPSKGASSGSSFGGVYEVREEKPVNSSFSRVVEVKNDKEVIEGRAEMGSVSGRAGKRTLLDDLRSRAIKGPGTLKSTRVGQAESLVEDNNRSSSPRAPAQVVHERSNVDPSLMDGFFSASSFSEAGASSEAIRALTAIGVTRPSHIQAMSYRALRSGHDCIIADQTGTGKTLAYLAPLAQRLREQEEKGTPLQQNRRPRVLILVPTTELAAQVLRVSRKLSEGGMPLRSMAVTGGFKLRTQAQSLAEGTDILVATPGRLLQHLNADRQLLTHVASVVVDEADILLDDDTFSQCLEPVRAALPAGVQFVHVTATLPEEVHRQLLRQHPSTKSLLGPSLHRTASGLQEILVDCSGGTDMSEEGAFARKRDALLQLVDKQLAAKTIIFCNKIDTCRKVENALQRHDRSCRKYQVVPYHAALTQERRTESMVEFLSGSGTQRCILVCTDRASRGVDSLDVDQVVLFDFPRDPSEYVRRVGRTARGAGGTGTCYVLALGKQAALARKIMDRNDRGQPIHNVPSDHY